MENKRGLKMYNDKISVNELKKEWNVKESQIYSGDLKCCLNSIFGNIERIGYNCGVYGWNYDVYEINNLYFVDGYRYPNIKKHLDYFKMKKLNERFKKQQQRLSDKLYNHKIKKSETFRRLLDKLVERQKAYFIKKLDVLM